MSSPRSSCKPVLHPILRPLVLLSKGNFQLLTLLIPPWHEHVAPILGYQLVFVNPFGLALELIILTKSTNIGLCTTRQTGLAEFAQGNNTIGGKVMQLYLKRLQDLMKEVCYWKAKPAKEEVPKDHDIGGLRLGNGLPFWSFHFGLT